ncbi:hypothetical protein KIN20_030606 [Parelaphostrongylus tenuis]|uniref:Uncharacterized protein n=1 Tax=Parelaphostrongylus tenuis TaxID=148309 RepID=A0AAD5WGI6_PARTN|nr:hypothetical protein KIN20_030606 [Parelaphostrongylus tenuis]
MGAQPERSSIASLRLGTSTSLKCDWYTAEVQSMIMAVTNWYSNRQIQFTHKKWPVKDRLESWTS